MHREFVDVLPSCIANLRTIKKSDDLTSVDWDLKNDHGIPIASGLYIIHIDATGVGEKILKWFGVLRPVDLDTF